MKKQKIEFILKKGEFMKLSLKLNGKDKKWKWSAADCKQIWDTLDIYKDNRTSKKNSRKCKRRIIKTQQRKENSPGIKINIPLNSNKNCKHQLLDIS